MLLEKSLYSYLYRDFSILAVCTSSTYEHIQYQIFRKDAQKCLVGLFGVFFPVSWLIIDFDAFHAALCAVSRAPLYMPVLHVFASTSYSDSSKQTDTDVQIAVCAVVRQLCHFSP